MASSRQTARKQTPMPLLKAPVHSPALHPPRSTRSSSSASIASPPPTPPQRASDSDFTPSLHANCQECTEAYKQYYEYTRIWARFQEFHCLVEFARDIPISGTKADFMAEVPEELPELRRGSLWDRVLLERRREAAERVCQPAYGDADSACALWVASRGEEHGSVCVGEERPVFSAVNWS